MKEKDQKSAIEHKEGQILLFESSYRAVPFNIIMAMVLATFLSQSAPTQVVFSWLALVTVVSFMRMVHCKLCIKRKVFDTTAAKRPLRLFLLFTLLSGLAWTSIYFAIIPYNSEQDLNVIMLFLAGMTAGGSASLAVYLPAFIIYIIAIFMPVIIYNFSFLEFKHAILGITYLFYLLAITIIAKTLHKLLEKIFTLTEQNQILVQKFERLSITDPLTDLYNRRYFSEMMQKEYSLARQNQQSFALISIDIDYFKLINDNFGHPFGDEFIVYTSDYLKHYFTPAKGIIFRLGGDEFMAILTNVTEDETKSICQKLIAEYKKAPKFEHDATPDPKNILQKIGMSIGIVYVPFESSASVEKIIEAADKALYESKNQGKNQIQYTNLNDLSKDVNRE